jgi:NitT/TauT family transport system substrate-binding protein
MSISDNGSSEDGCEVEILYCKGISLMPMLLVTGQIDGYITMTPFMGVAEEAGIGRLACLSTNFPPVGKWTGHPCCVFVANGAITANHPDIVRALCALNILAADYINNHSKHSSEITAKWLMGERNFTFGDVSISSGVALNRSAGAIKYTTTPTDRWLRYSQLLIDRQSELLNLGSVPGGVADESSLQAVIDLSFYQDAIGMIERGRIKTPKPTENTLSLGYLMEDHHAGLFTAVKEWRYFNDTYGIALKPVDEEAGRPQELDLMVNGQFVARIALISAPSGPPLMSLLEQDCIQMAYVGIMPAIGAATLGGELKILHPINTGGSGLVMSPGSGVSDWAGFSSLARERFMQGKPLRIGDPQPGSIQDTMLKMALSEAGIRYVKVEES